MAGVRCFTALPLTEAVAADIERATAVFRDLDPAWKGEKWVAPENLHVTLKFMGSIPEEDVEALADALAEEFAGHWRFELPLAGLRAVPKTRRASMIWATFLDPDGSAERLAEAAERAALRFGVAPEERSFKPHVTLVRARRPRHISEDALTAAEQALSASPVSMSVPAVTFLSSRTTPRGPIYTQLRSFELLG